MRRSQRVVFPNQQGDELAGRLELPSEPPLAFAVFAHCFTCSKDVHAASRISRALCSRGLAVLRFDFTGLGSSGGDFANTNFSSNVEDLLAAADFLRRHFQPPQLLIGHSLGGAAVLLAAPGIPETRALVTIAAPSEPSHVRRLLKPQDDTIRELGEAPVVLGGREFKIKRQFLEDMENKRILDGLGKLDKALLIFHAPGDLIVGIDHARLIFDAARHPKSFISLDNADHLLSERRDSEYVAATLSAWVERFLELRSGSARDTTPGKVLVQSEQGLTNEVHAGHHRLMADEPVSAGGDDTGPNPYDYLLAALGACTSMTLRMYARRKGWPLESISVELEHSRVHAKDSDECDTKVGFVDQINRRIRVTGSLDKEQRRRLLEIAHKCPVHRTLLGEIRIPSTLDVVA